MAHSYQDNIEDEFYEKS